MSTTPDRIFDDSSACTNGAEAELPLHGVEFGSGEQPLVFLHGLGRNHSTFLTLARRLSGFWNSWLLDLRGHGASPRDEHGSRYLVVDYVPDVSGWLRGRWSRPAVLYGHSLGAMVAAAVAAANPREVAAVILEDPPFETMGDRIPGTFWEYLFQGLSRVSRCSQVRRGDGESAAANSLMEGLSGIPVPVDGEDQLQPLKRLRDKASLEFSAECLAEVDPAVFDPVTAGMWLRGYDLEAICRSITCPVFLLQGNGELGSAFRPEDAEIFRRTVRQCEFKHFSDKGHQIHWPEPDTVLPIFNELEDALKARTSI